MRLLDRARVLATERLLGVEVERHVAQLLLDVAHDLALGRRRQRVAAFRHQLHEELGQVAPGQVQTENRVRQRVALVDGHRVTHTVARIEHDARRAPTRVQRQHRLDGHVEGGHVEGLEADLRHLLAVRFRVQRGLRHQHRVLLGGHTQLVVERVMPDPS